MAYFDEQRGIVLEDGDLECERPHWVKHLLEFVMGKPQLEFPKPKKVNLLK